MIQNMVEQIEAFATVGGGVHLKITTPELGHDANDSGVDLSPDSARELAAELNAAADEADGGVPEPALVTPEPVKYNIRQQDTRGPRAGEWNPKLTWGDATLAKAIDLVMQWVDLDGFRFRIERADTGEVVWEQKP